MKRIAVYGSLKSGKYNNSILSGSELVGNTTVKGTLYRVSSYPALLNEGENEYEAEVYEVDDRTYQAIKGMELGAGYKEETIDVFGKDTIVYYADSYLAERCRQSKEQIETY